MYFYQCDQCGWSGTEGKCENCRDETELQKLQVPEIIEPLIKSKAGKEIELRLHLHDALKAKHRAEEKNKSMRCCANCTCYTKGMCDAVGEPMEAAPDGFKPRYDAHGCEFWYSAEWVDV